MSQAPIHQNAQTAVPVLTGVLSRPGSIGMRGWNTRLINAWVVALRDGMPGGVDVYGALPESP
jgi:hypothetical protein